MKIVMITPDSYMIDRRIILEAKSLIKAGHSVTLLAGFECNLEEHYEQDGILIHRYKYDWDDERLKKIRAKLPNNDKLKMFVNRAYMKIARKFFEINPFDQYMLSKLLELEADVIHVHDLPCLKVGVKAAQIKKIPLVYDAHELYYAQDVLPKYLQKKYFKEEKKYIFYANLIITVNPFIAKLMAERYHVPEPKVIMNCTELPDKLNRVEARDYLKQKIEIKKESKIVLYQGWISPERNIETIIRSVQFFNNNIFLVIIGYGEYEARLREIVEEIGVMDKVFFLGKVPSEEMLYYSVGADLGLIPYRPIDDNHLYCSPNKLFEYVLAHVPVVTDDLPFFKLMSNKYGFIKTTDMGSPQSLGNTINEMLATENELISLKQKCATAAKELNWDVEGQKLVDYYKNIILPN